LGHDVQTDDEAGFTVHDHLEWTTADLAVGVEALESLAGVDYEVEGLAAMGADDGLGYFHAEPYAAGGKRQGGFERGRLGGRCGDGAPAWVGRCAGIRLVVMRGCDGSGCGDLQVGGDFADGGVGFHGQEDGAADVVG
jgi:hypothetical protein